MARLEQSNNQEEVETLILEDSVRQPIHIHLGGVNSESLSSAHAIVARRRISTKVIALAVVSGVAVGAGMAVYNKVGDAIDSITEGVRPEIDVEMEADAALDRVTMPNSTILVDAHGSGSLATAIDVACPDLYSYICNVTLGGVNGVVPYMRASSEVTGSIQYIAQEGAITLDAQIDDAGNPYPVATINSDLIQAQFVTENPNTHVQEFLAADFADLLGVETGADEMRDTTEATARDVFQDTCGTQAERVFNAAVARAVVSRITSAESLIREEYPDAADWLHRLAEQPVGEIETGVFTLVSDNPMEAGRTVDHGITITRVTPDGCEITDGANSSLVGAESTEGTAYIVLKSARRDK